MKKMLKFMDFTSRFNKSHPDVGKLIERFQNWEVEDLNIEKLNLKEKKRAQKKAAKIKLETGKNEPIEVEAVFEHGEMSDWSLTEKNQLLGFDALNLENEVNQMMQSQTRKNGKKEKDASTVNDLDLTYALHEPDGVFVETASVQLSKKGKGQIEQSEASIDDSIDDINLLASSPKDWRSKSIVYN